MGDVQSKKCVPCEVGDTPLAEKEVGALRTQVPYWKVVDGHHLKRRFTFKNFAEALLFVNKVGVLAESEGHHPDISFGWGYVEISTFTHAVDLPAPRPNAFYIYAIKCENDSVYIGQTEDLPKRWKEHKNGIASEWTKKCRPLYIVHYEELSSREEAVKREKDLKTGFGRKWLKREIESGRARQAGGLSENDFILAAKIDTLLS